MKSHNREKARLKFHHLYLANVADEEVEEIVPDEVDADAVEPGSAVFTAHPEVSLVVFTLGFLTTIGP